ncbi:hypothetical protein [Kitasatospora sp. NPDC094016]|uniref:hypothetical protein n=1 Tax=Kitasatospora sp. NPDC094016 TaxID=3154986 RepID=UPI003329B031
MVAVVLRTRPVWVRPAAAGDRQQIAGLIAADQLASPLATMSRAQAFDFRRPDGTVVVAHDGFGMVLGAMALRRRAAAGRLTGGVAWLHCRENPEAATALVRAAIERGSALAAITAFTNPGPAEPGFPGLPLHDRPVSTEVFGDAGFRTMDQWLLFHRPGRRGASVACGGPSPWVTPEGVLPAQRRPALPALTLAEWRERLHRSLERFDQTGGDGALATVDLLRSLALT